MSTIPINIQKLSDFYGISQSELEEKSLKDLRRMSDCMEYKIAEHISVDEDYAANIRKWFTPYHSLKQWFTDEEIINACAHCNLTLRQLTDEVPVPYESTYDPSKYQLAEYLKNEHRHIPNYNHMGQRLYEDKYVLCRIYRMKAKYQGNYHGPVIKLLLIRKFPWLAKYEPACYSWDYDTDKYEIYPNNHIYTPIVALMTGDTEAIKKRNREYAKSYNSGAYTPQAVEDRIIACKEYFDKIASIHP